MEPFLRTLLSLLSVCVGAGALTVTIGRPEFEFARGDNVSLPCTFKPRDPAPKLVIVSWFVEGLETNAQETLVLTYYFPSKITDIKSTYERRVSLDVDVSTGKANLRLSSITLDDNKVFQCRVQIPGDDEGKLFDTTRLVVLVAPSTPICKVQGKAEYGQNINLTCVSEEGSPPPVYKWTSSDVRHMPRVPHPRTTDKGGVLSLFNISKETSGYYNCTSTNKIRSASCNITLSVLPPSMNIGSTAGIIAAVAGGLIVLAVVIYCCCCRKKKGEEEEYAMGVREEAYSDKEPARNGNRKDDIRVDEEASSGRNATDRREQDYNDRRSNYDDRRRDYDDRRSDYDDRRSDYDDRGRDYDDRRSDYDDRRSDYDDRRRDYDDRRRDYDDQHSKYSDRHERYDDERRNDEERRRDRRYDADGQYNDDGRYDEPYDERAPPTVPSNKPQRRDYDD